MRHEPPEAIHANPMVELRDHFTNARATALELRTVLAPIRAAMPPGR